MRVLITSNGFGKFDEAPRKRMLDLGWELFDNRYYHIMSEEEMMNETPSVDAIILGSDIISKRVLDRADRLKIISRCGVGIDNIDTAEVRKRGTAVMVTENCNTEAVTDYTVVLMLATLRHVYNAYSSLRRGIWRKETGMDLYHKTVGVFGLGVTSRQVVKRLKGFEPKTLGYGIFTDEEYCEKEEICLLFPREIFEQADIIILHVPVNADGTRFIVQREPELMKPEAVLINTIRTFLIDETAMAQALRQKRTYGYGTNVFDGGPHTSPGFIGSNNVVCGPHTAAVSVKAVNTISHAAVKHLMEYLEVIKRQEKPYMKHIAWTRIDNRLVRGQVTTQWVQYTEASEVLIIDDDVAKDPFLQMVMKSSVPGGISLKVLSVRNVIGYLNEDGEHEKVVILVKTSVVLGELSDAGVHLKDTNVEGIGAKVGRKPMFKNISISEEGKEASRNLLSKGINMSLRVIVIEPEKDIARYLQKENGIPMRIKSSQVVYRR